MRARTLAFLVAAACGSPPANRPGTLVFRGMCDASAGVPLGDDRFAVADDEDNRLRVYRRGAPGREAELIDLGPFLELETKSAEVDFEAAARVGDRIYWIGSHGRSKKGKPRPNRLRFVATDLALAPQGKPYTNLLDDLVAASGHDLAAAAQLAPSARGGLNIEGLIATPEGQLLIGFRNPIPDGQALVVPLENPGDLVSGSGAQARFGAPRRIDLGGLGVRALARWKDRYVIVAGAFDDAHESRLFLWDGTGAATPLAVDLGDLNPEALIVFSDAERGLLLSDDGSRDSGGQPCKDLANPDAKSFRAGWIDPP